MSDSKFSTDEQIVSYGLGRQMGQQLMSNRIDGLDVALVQAGIEDAFAQAASPLTNEQLQQAFEAVNTKLQARAQQEAEAAAAEGIAYLEENAQKPGVITTDSGLQYEVLTEGTGPKPDASSKVRTHYHGTFIDGRVFDSSVERGQPAEFPVNGVIAGWTEALQLMGTGSKWRLTIPYQLAYGAQGSPGGIPPYATLVFEVELLAIVES